MCGENVNTLKFYHEIKLHYHLNVCLSGLFYGERTLWMGVWTLGFNETFVLSVCIVRTQYSFIMRPGLIFLLKHILGSALMSLCVHCYSHCYSIISLE